jgi:hypothetical protein
MSKCEIRWCKSGKPATKSTTEIIGDGAYRVSVCSDCRELFGDTLPEAHQVQKRLKAKQALGVER